MVGFSVGAKLRLVLRLKETGPAARSRRGNKSASSSKSPTIKRTRAEYSNDKPRENLHAPEAAASAHPDGVTNRSSTGGASRLCLGAWARYGRRPPPLHKKSWSEMGSDAGERRGHHTVSSGLTGDKKSGPPAGRRGGRARQGTCSAP